MNPSTLRNLRLETHFNFAFHFQAFILQKKKVVLLLDGFGIRLLAICSFDFSKGFILIASDMEK